uniref:SOS1/NGEF-like PH domain-containing protein n=1 Tax=Meloidogyne incognita TaxID=6306 RepID=A0A914NHT0_MELIC
MMGLLAQINASMEQLKLLDYSGALNLGSLRLRTEFTVSIFYRSKSAGAKELIKHCPTEQSLQHVQTALTSMMGLLTRIYASMEHLVLLGYSGDCLGSLRLKTEATISIFHRAKAGAKTANSGRKKGNEQEMHLLYFDGGILLCDLQTTTTTQDCQYFIHKFCIPVESLGFAKNSRNSNERFEIWDTKSGNSAKYCFVIKISNEDIRKMLIRKLSKKLL